MKARLIIQHEAGDETRYCEEFPDDYAAAVLEGAFFDGACPGCGRDPFVVRLATEATQHGTHDYRAGGVCSNPRCGAEVGYVYLDVSLFGHHEDDVVLGSGRRARVY